MSKLRILLVGAIPMDNHKTVDKDVCMACMRCISVCPTGARVVDETMKAELVEKLTTMCTERKNTSDYEGVFLLFQK